MRHLTFGFVLFFLLPLTGGNATHPPLPPVQAGYTRVTIAGGITVDYPIYLNYGSEGDAHDIPALNECFNDPEHIVRVTPP